MKAKNKGKFFHNGTKFWQDLPANYPWAHREGKVLPLIQKKTPPKKKKSLHRIRKSSMLIYIYIYTYSKLI